jgi:hypothetical protein
MRRFSVRRLGFDSRRRWGPPGRTGRRALPAVCVAMVTLTSACRSDRPVMTIEPTDTPQPDASGEHVMTPEAAGYASLAARQNRRVASLRRIAAEGTLSVRWTEEGRPRYEQGDIELWIDSEDRFALRVYKAAVGEEFLWLGADASRHWLFDLRNHDEPAVVVRSHAAPDAWAVPDSDDSMPIELSPRSLLDLMGVTPLPLVSVPGSPVADPTVTTDAEGNVRIVTVMGRGGIIRYGFDSSAHLPVWTELLGANGEVLVRGELALDQYESVELDDQPPGAYPKLPMRVRILDPATGSETMQIELGFATARNSRMPANDRLFDLDVLMNRFQPTTVDDRRAAAP